jgi:HEAT repeat protein
MPLAAMLTVAIIVAAAQADARALSTGLSSSDPSVRTKAACDLRDLGKDAAPALPQLVALLADGSPVDPGVCGEHTWRSGRSHSIQGADLTSPGEQAASTLVAIGTPAYEPLTRALKGSAWIARSNAAWALGALGNRAVTGLTEALKDAEPRVRQQAAWALGAIGDHGGVDGLVGALSDASATVREQAAWALGAIGDGRASAALAKSLKDTDARVRRQAAWALGAIGG